MDPVVAVLLVLPSFGLIEAILLEIPLTNPWNWIAQVVLPAVLLAVFLNWLVWLSLPPRGLPR